MLHCMLILEVNATTPALQMYNGSLNVTLTDIFPYFQTACYWQPNCDIYLSIYQSININGSKVWIYRLFLTSKALLVFFFYIFGFEILYALATLLILFQRILLLRCLITFTVHYIHLMLFDRNNLHVSANTQFGQFGVQYLMFKDTLTFGKEGCNWAMACPDCLPSRQPLNILWKTSYRDLLDLMYLLFLLKQIHYELLWMSNCLWEVGIHFCSPKISNLSFPTTSMLAYYLSFRKHMLMNKIMY